MTRRLECLKNVIMSATALEVVMESTYVFGKMCRLCTASDGCLYDVRESNLVKTIQQLLSVKITDTGSLPKLICLRCTNQIEAFRTFKNMCIRNNRKFSELLTLPEVSEKETIEIIDLHELEIDVVGIDEDPDFAVSNEKDVSASVNCYSSSCVEVQSDIAVCCEKNVSDGEMCCSSEVQMSKVVEIVTSVPDEVLKTPKKKNVKEFSSKDITKPIHLNPPLRIQLLCSKCSLRFPTASSFESHRLKSGHEECLTAYTCLTCEKCFIGRRAIQEHRKIHTKRRKHSCLFCEKSFTSSYLKSRHLQSSHVPGKKFTCQHCKKTFLFNSQKKFEIYLKTVHLCVNENNKTV